MICRPCLAKLILNHYIEKQGRLICTEVGCAARISRDEIEVSIVIFLMRLVNYRER